jgi:hypothetical protein
MRTLLVILTREHDAFAQEVSAREQEQPHYQVETVDLTAGEPDYAVLLQKVFAADSVQVW